MSQPLLIITGASRGIGLATAQLFLETGYRVINLSRKKPALDDIEHIETDLAQVNWPAVIGSKLLEAVAGEQEIALIHNAGLLCKDSVDTAVLPSVLQVNVVAPAQLNQLLLPSMRANSSITYVGSTLSEKAVANSFSYVTSKHAMVGMMRATCQDLAGRAIHTSCVCPGFTETEMLRDHVGGSEEILQSIAGGVTFGRLIEPIEIARTLLFAAQNAVINGAVLHANLGQREA